MKCKCTEYGDSNRKEKVTANISFDIPTDNAKETIREINHIATHYSMSVYQLMKVFGIKESDLKWNVKEI